MAEENISQEFRLKHKDKTRNYFVEEIEQTKFLSYKHKKVWATLNYNEHFFILASTVSGFIFISASASLVDISIEITCSPIGLKMSSISLGIKKYKSIKEKEAW